MRHYLVDLVGLQDVVTATEVRIRHPVGETSHADPDAFKDTIAGQLLQHESGIDLSGHLVVVGHDAADEVRLGSVQRGHQGVQLVLVEAGHGFTTATLKKCWRRRWS